MKIEYFCREILFGKTMREKLTSPSSFEWDGERKKLPSIPSFPGRARSLKPGGSLEKSPFPRPNQLRSPEDLGKILHFFANHELLALELMALFLLRFPLTPLSFQKGMVKIMGEEQKHLLLYKQRMECLGVELGDFPLNDFFWRQMSASPNPMAFLSAMSLTFEQANLDYCLSYKKIFEDLGDKESASIMQTIYDDEIGHVRYGLLWFEKWKEPGQSLWEAYEKNLFFPVTPARAKGMIFSREARIEAGLPGDFISRLELFSHSKGRPPSLYLFNPECEWRWEKGKIGAPLPRKLSDRIKDMETLPLFLGNEGDLLLVRSLPHTAYLKSLREGGFPLPQFVPYEEKGGKRNFKKSGLLDRKVSALFPWGWSPDIFRDFTPLYKNVVKDATPYPPPANCQSLAPLFSKSRGTEILKKYLAFEKNLPLCSPEVVGEVYDSCEGALAHGDQLRKKGFPSIVIKGIYGAAGRNFLLLEKEGPLHENQHKWLENLLKKQGSLIVEPWLDRLMDFSIQLTITADSTKLLGINRMVNDSRGAYRGAILGNYLSDLPAELLRFLNPGPQKKKPLSLLSHSLADFVGEELREAGYRGAVGIDAFLYRHEGELRIKPLSEINPRFNMGRLTLELSRHLCRGTLAHWRIIDKKELKRLGFENFIALADYLEREFPLKKGGKRGELLREGALFTTDARKAVEVATLLVVEPEEAPIPLKFQTAPPSVTQ